MLSPLIFLNCYARLKLSKTVPNSRVIHNYVSGDNCFKDEETLKAFKIKENEFFSEYIETGRINIYSWHENNYISDLLDSLQYFRDNNIQVDGLFIDYIQLLYMKKITFKETKN